MDTKRLKRLSFHIKKNFENSISSVKIILEITFRMTSSITLKIWIRYTTFVPSIVFLLFSKYSFLSSPVSNINFKHVEIDGVFFKKNLGLALYMLTEHAQNNKNLN